MLTLSEVKQWLRLEEGDTSEDALLQLIIDVATEYVRNAAPSWVDINTNPIARMLGLVLAADMYENREAMNQLRSNQPRLEIRPTVRALMAQLQNAYPSPEETGETT